jgi:ssDNA-binding Zn-finger/Zn-ribbon topoisomerase 1
MRITESRLRRIIRSVIAENLDAMGNAKKITGSIHPYKEEEGDLFSKVNQFMKDTLSVIVDPKCNIIWADQYSMSCEKELMYICRRDYFNEAGDDLYNYNDLITCEFEVQPTSSKLENTTLYNFINTCGNCKSFTVKAQIEDMGVSGTLFGDVVLSLESRT